MTKAQKMLVLECNGRRMGQPSRVQKEFQRAAAANLVANVAVIAEPILTQISSFLSYERQKRRGGVSVGKATLEDLQSLADSLKYVEFFWFVNHEILNKQLTNVPLIIFNRCR